MAKRTPGPFETTPKDYLDKEVIRPGYMSEYYEFLNDDEAAFLKKVMQMYDDPRKAKAAGEVALGIIEARRVEERRTPKRELQSFRRKTEDLLADGILPKYISESIYGKRAPGDRMPQNMIEGQRLAETFPEAMSDDDFMRISIAKIVEADARPPASMMQDAKDYMYKYVRDNDPGGLDKARSPQGIRFKPTPPPGFTTYSSGEMTGVQAYEDGYRPLEEEVAVPDAALRPEDRKKRKR